MVQASENSALDAIPAVVGYDRSLIFEPARIRAALLDLATDDEVGVELIVLSVRLNVPQLVMAQDEAAAQLQLVNSAGMRVEVARAHVAAWRHALGVRAGGEDGTSTAGEGYLDLRGAAPAVELSALGPADCQVWADGSVSVLVLGMDGLTLATFDTPVCAGVATWHRIAAPQAPVSRAAIMVPVGPATSTIIWTDNSGLWSRPVRRTSGGTIEIGDARIVDNPEAGQARYPIAALAVDGREIDMFWTVDRRQLLVSTRNGLGYLERRSVPSPCQATERLAVLDCAVASGATAWVAALTDRGRILLTRWDIGSGELDGWRVLSCPVADPRALTIVTLPAGTSLMVSNSRDPIGCADAAAAYAGAAVWSDLNPSRPRRWTGLSSLAASSRGDVAWAVATVDGCLQLIRLQRYDETTTEIECLAVR